MALVGDSEFAVSQCIPQFDRSIAGTRDDLTVIGGERDREDIVGVANKPTGGGTSRELPETESLVPRCR